jgi:hypothetical protein
VACRTDSDQLRSPVDLFGVDARVTAKKLRRGDDVVDLGADFRAAVGVGEPAARVARENPPARPLGQPAGTIARPASLLLAGWSGHSSSVVPGADRRRQGQQSRPSA